MRVLQDLAKSTLRRGEFKSGVFTRKTHQMLSVGGNTQQSPAILDLRLKKPRAGKSRDYRDVIVFKVDMPKTKSRRFQTPPVNERFRKSAILVTDKCGR